MDGSCDAQARLEVGYESPPGLIGWSSSYKDRIAGPSESACVARVPMPITVVARTAASRMVRKAVFGRIGVISSGFEVHLMSYRAVYERNLNTARHIVQHNIAPMIVR